MKCWRVTILIFALFWAAACSRTAKLTDPCDVLVAIPDAPAEVNRILVDRARPTAQGLAKHKLRVQKYGCAK